MDHARPLPPSPRRRTPLTRRATGLVPLLALALVGAGATVPAAAATTTISGRVTFAAGAEPDATATLRVYAVRSAGDTLAAAAVDAGGRYTLQVSEPVAIYVQTGRTGTVWAPEYYGGVYGLADAPLVGAGTEATSHDVELDVGGSITGRVTVPPGTDPTEWDVYANAIDTRGAEYVWDPVPIAADGSYTVTGLTPRPHRVSFASDHGGEVFDDVRWEGVETPVPVQLGQVTAGIDARLHFDASVEAMEQWSVAGSPLPVAAEILTSRKDRTPTGEVQLLRGDEVLGRTAAGAGPLSVPRPDLPEGSHDLRLTYTGDESYPASSWEVTVHVTADVPLAVNGINEGPASGGAEAERWYTLDGAGFASDARVTVDGRPATATVTSSTSLWMWLPPQPPGRAVEVAVTSARHGADVTATRTLMLPEVVPVRPWRAIEAFTARQVCQKVTLPRVEDRATGAFVNVTAVTPVDPGYAVVHPDDGSGAPPRPSGSTVNYEPDAEVANATFVPLGPDGRICLTPVSGPYARDLLVDVTAYTMGDAGVVGVASERLLDTRPGGVGEVDGPVRPRARHTVQVAGRAGVPADASAVLLNVTTTQATAPGNVRVYPGGADVPDTSVVNHAPGRDKANGTLVRLVDGKISFTSDSTGPAHVLLDVIGWTTAESTLTPAATPTRVLDTRAGSRVGPLDGPLPARQARSLPLAGVGPVPADATAVVLNVTAIGPRGVGNLRVYPDTNGDGTTEPPDASTLNYITGRDVPNQVVVQLPPSGRVALYSDTASGPVDVAADVVGWVTGPPAER